MTLAPVVVGTDFLMYHGAIMLFAWWLLGTASIFFARYLKDVSDNWCGARPSLASLAQTDVGRPRARARAGRSVTPWSAC